MKDIIVIFSFWAIFCPFTPLTAQKIKIKKMNTWRYHFTYVYPKLWSDKQFLRYGVQQMDRQMDWQMGKVTLAVPHLKTWKFFSFCVWPTTWKIPYTFRPNFSHLKEHNFRHGFADTINSRCPYRADVETTEHFLLHCHFYSTQRFELFNNLERGNLSGKDQVSFMLYHSKTNNYENFNQNIIKIVIKYLKKTGHFD